MDVGGTLTKIVYFETQNGKKTSLDLQKSNHRNGDTIEVPGRQQIKRVSSLEHLGNPDHQQALSELYAYMEGSDRIYTRDEGLSFYSSLLGGRLHFLHFETRNMVKGIDILSVTGMTENIKTIGCTGGGAHKYANAIDEHLGIKLKQLDELGSLVRGMHFALTNVVEECYTYRNQDNSDHSKVAKDSSVSLSTTSSKSVQAVDLVQSVKNQSASSLLPDEDTKQSQNPIDDESSHNNATENTSNHSIKNEKPPIMKKESVKDKGWHRDVKEFTYKVR